MSSKSAKLNVLFHMHKNMWTHIPKLLLKTPKPMTYLYELLKVIFFVSFIVDLANNTSS